MRQDLTRHIRIATPPAAVWAALLDFERVASWLSIVKEIREVKPMRRYTAVLEDRMGPFALRADLAVTVAAAEDERRHVTASGEDRPGHGYRQRSTSPSRTTPAAAPSR